VKAFRSVVRRAAVAAALAAPAPLLAQGGVTGFSGVEVRSVSYQAGLGIKSVSEVAVPIAVMWAASPRLTLDLGGWYASASRKGDSATSTISGPTDVQLRGVYQLVPDLAVLTVAVNLPTGKTKLASDQLLTAGAIASDLIPYPVVNFGTGFNVTSGLALAVPVSGWALGVAGSYRLNGGFTPFSDTTGSYKAGGEFRVRLGADRIVGQGRVSLGVTFSTFGEDNYASSPIFQSGKRYIGQGSWSFPVGKMGLQVYAWDLYRAAGAQLITSSSVSTQKRNVLAFGAAGSIQAGRNVLRPQIEYRLHTIGSSSPTSAGKLLMLGMQYQMSLNDRFMLQPGVRFDTGSENVLDAAGDPTSQSATLTGFSVSVMLRARM